MWSFLADATLPAWMRGGVAGGVVPGASSTRSFGDSSETGGRRSRSGSFERVRERRPTSRSRSRSRDLSRSRGRRDEHFDRRSRSPPGGNASPANVEQRMLIQNAMVAASVGAASSDMVRRAKRLYVGGLPSCSDAEVAAFFNSAIGKVYHPGDHVVSAYVHPDKQFAFVELRDLAGRCTNARIRCSTNEDIHDSGFTSPALPNHAAFIFAVATACLQFDGVQFKGSVLRVRRPHDFNQAALQGAVSKRTLSLLESSSSIR